MKISTIIASLVIALLAGASIAIGNEYMKNQKTIHDLQVAKVAKEEKREQQAFDMEVERFKGYIDFLPEDYEVEDYDTWKDAKKTAAHMYEDSEGLFKMDWGIFLSLEANKRDIDPMLVYELLKVETGDTFDPDLEGPDTKYGKAYGLGQFMKNTAPWIADLAGLPYDEEKLYDPHYSINLSVEYLDYLHQQYDDWDHALTAYHRGMYGLEQYIDNNGDARSWYAVEIQEKAESNGLVAIDQN